MRESKYLNWVAGHTDTQWCNDSALIDDINAALKCGATGCTSNPPLTYEALTTTPDLFKEEVAKIPADLIGDDRVVALIGIVVRSISRRLFNVYENSNGEYGYIRTQVQPGLSDNAEAMLKMGKTFASWGENVMVKIPGTAAGMWVLEELAALGIPTNPTVCVTVSQMIAAAEAYERGVKRAIENGIRPARSTSAFVMGRLQDYLTLLNEERKTGLSVTDLELAALGAVKRCYQIFNERGYKQKLMPAAFRCAQQVSQMAGGKVVMTIHPKIQDMVIAADMAGEIKREASIDKPVDKKVIEKVIKALPEFAQAYEPDYLSEKDFGGYGATVMTLKGFDVTGWQKLLTL